MIERVKDMDVKNFVSVEKLQLFLTNIKKLIDKKADKQEIKLDILESNGWIDGSYSFESEYPSSSFDLEIAPDGTCTTEQLDSYNAAKIVGSYNQNVLTTKGNIPTIDIPIILKVVKK